MVPKKLTQERLKDLLDYDPDTGIFVWKVATAQKIQVGDIAGGVGTQGYITMGIKAVRYRAHRLVWLYVHGYFPENNIDHINRNRADNRLCNLREVSQQCNTRNTGLRSTNTTGVKGVYWDKDNSKWRASITVEAKSINLGRYEKFIGAAMARWEAEKKYNFQNCCSDSSAYLYLKENNALGDNK